MRLSSIRAGKATLFSPYSLGPERVFPCLMLHRSFPCALQPKVIPASKRFMNLDEPVRSYIGQDVFDNTAWE